MLSPAQAHLRRAAVAEPGLVRKAPQPPLGAVLSAPHVRAHAIDTFESSCASRCVRGRRLSRPRRAAISQGSRASSGCGAATNALRLAQLLGRAANKVANHVGAGPNLVQFLNDAAWMGATCVGTADGSSGGTGVSRRGLGVVA